MTKQQIQEATIKNTLKLLHEKGLIQLKEKETSPLSLDELAKQHVKTQQRLDDLQAQIDALLAQQQLEQEKLDKVEESIRAAFGETKSKSEKFGKIIIEMKVTRFSYVTKNSPQYKKMIDDLVATGKVQQAVVDKLYDKYNNGGKTVSGTNRELTVTKESIQLKESAFDVFKNIYNGIIGVFKKYLKVFSHRVDDLEIKFEQLKTMAG